MNTKDFINKYVELRSTYKTLAFKVSQILTEILEINNVNYHIITSRAKTIESFSEKIKKPKYDNPLEQLTDLAGIRIIGYVENDVLQISKLVEDIFQIDESNSLDKGKDLGIDKVGYKSVHYICSLPKNRIKLPEYSRFENLKFEIQIRTILQHSWAEIEHDKNYKFSGELPYEIQRRFKLLAGALEMADREFNQISEEIDKYSEKVKENTKKGDLEIPINSTSLKEFLKSKFEKAIEKGVLVPSFNSSRNLKDMLNELDDFGIETLEQLNNIIPKNLEEILIKYKDDGNFLGLVRTILMSSDLEKYFTHCHKNHWGNLSPDSEIILSELGVDVEKLLIYLKK